MKEEKGDTVKTNTREYEINKMSVLALQQSL